MPTSESLLHIYLRDHLAGATGGRELARRLAGAHRGKPDAEELAGFAAAVDEDRQALLDIMAALKVRPDPIKATLAVVGERLGRLKLNGSLLQRSPLSDVVELEMMRLGVEGKASGWRTLREVADDDPRLSKERLDQLIARALEQIALLERLRIDRVRATFVA